MLEGFSINIPIPIISMIKIVIYGASPALGLGKISSLNENTYTEDLDGARSSTMAGTHITVSLGDCISGTG